MKSYSLQLPSGLWVSSPTNTTTAIPALRASFGTKWGNPSEANRDATKANLERVHGPLTIVENER